MRNFFRHWVTGFVLLALIPAFSLAQKVDNFVPSGSSPSFVNLTLSGIISQLTTTSGDIADFLSSGANGFITAGSSAVHVQIGGISNAPFIKSTNTVPLMVGTPGGTSESLLSSDATNTKTSNYPILNSDSGYYFDNLGASGEVDFTLPVWAAGLQYCFTVEAVQILKVIAPASAKIAVGTTNSTTAGNITANTLFSTICIFATSNGNQWAAKSVTGSWTVN